MNPEIEALIDKSGSCWLWRGAFNQKKRKPIFIQKNHKVLYMHQEVWRSLHGKIPEKGMIFRTCYNQRCLRPEHIQLIVPGETHPERPVQTPKQLGELGEQNKHVRDIIKEEKNYNLSLTLK